jgi:hypothetical protein
MVPRPRDGICVVVSFIGFGILQLRFFLFFSFGA